MFLTKYIFLLVMLCISASCRITPQQQEVIRSDIDQVTAEQPAPHEIKQLISQLHSTNKAPNPKNEDGVHFPDNYDVEAAKKVRTAEEKLISLGTIAFPYLIDNLDNNAYSMSYDTSILRSFSVGEVCFMIIENQVELFGMNYKSRLGTDGQYHVYRGYFSTYAEGRWFAKAGMQRWWDENQSLSLEDMQVKALHWKIEREKKIGFPDDRYREHYLLPVQQKLDQLLGNRPG